MAFIRRKTSPDGRRVYLYRVETYRDLAGKVRQRQTYMGPEEQARTVVQPDASPVTPATLRETAITAAERAGLLQAIHEQLGLECGEELLRLALARQQRPRFFAELPQADPTFPLADAWARLAALEPALVTAALAPIADSCLGPSQGPEVATILPGAGDSSSVAIFRPEGVPIWHKTLRGGATWANLFPAMRSFQESGRGNLKLHVPRGLPPLAMRRLFAAWGMGTLTALDRDDRGFALARQLLRAQPSHQGAGGTVFQTANHTATDGPRFYTGFDLPARRGAVLSEYWALLQRKVGKAQDWLDEAAASAARRNERDVQEFLGPLGRYVRLEKDAWGTPVIRLHQDRLAARLDAIERTVLVSEDEGMQGEFAVRTQLNQASLAKAWDGTTPAHSFLSALALLSNAVADPAATPGA